MEPEGTTDELACQSVSSKIAFFQSKVGNSEEEKGVKQSTTGPQPLRAVAASIESTAVPATETTNKAEKKSTTLPVTTRKAEKKSTTLPVKETMVKSGSSTTVLYTKKPDGFGKAFDEELRLKIHEVSARKSSGFSPNDMEIFKRPMCLMRTVEMENELNLEMSMETADQIAQIEWPIVIVAVVGLYRTGKSYLMNRLAGSTGGFTLGDCIEATTKGIWTWCHVHPKKENTVLLLIDTEGLGDIEKGDPRHDNKIFTLAALLCNCLVYNMKGAFDQDAVSKLTFVTEIANNIRMKGGPSTDNDRINLVLPDFVLCVRDFSLKLSRKGKKISEDEYLEHGLAIQEDRDEKFNKPRECIRKYFKVRRCFTFPVPGDGDVLENLDKLPFNKLSPKFKEATERFVSYIYSLKPKKILASKPINGQMFTALADHYLTAIRHGAVPDVYDAFTAAAKIENSRIRKEALEVFVEQMAKIMTPIPTRNLDTFYTQAQQITLNYLRENVVQDIDGKCERNVQMEMDTFWTTLKEENTRKVREISSEKLQETYKAYMEEKVETGIYEEAGGHRKFQRDLEKMKSDYMICLREYDEHEVLLSWLGFQETMKEKEANIIAKDDALSAKEKEDERKQNEKQMEKILKEHEESRAKALQEQEEALKKHYIKLYEDREKQSEKDMEKMEALLKAKLETKRAEEEAAKLKREREERKNTGFFGRIWNAVWNY